MLCYKPKLSLQDIMEPMPFWKLFCWVTFIEEFRAVRAAMEEGSRYIISFATFPLWLGYCIE